MKKKLIIWASFLVVFLSFSNGAKTAPQFQNGDVILQTSQSSQSQAIQLATHSRWTHVGIIYYRSGTPYVYEAHGPVGFRRLSDWIASGVSSRYMVRRLRGGISSSQLSALMRVGNTFAGNPYDIYFGWTDGRIYCSELVWKMFYRGLGVSVGSLQKLGDFDLSDPRVQKILRERYGNNIPYGETVVSPQAIAVTSSLETVYSN